MRRTGLMMIALVLFILLLPTSVLAADFGPEEWHQYRMNSDKNAVFDNGEDALDFTTFETEDEIRSTPVVAGNKLFVGNHNTGDVFAFDIHTGEELWHSKAPNWIHSEMIYHDGMVYVGVGNRFVQEDTGMRGTEESGVFAYDAETGEEVWKLNTDGEVMPTPVYYEDAVYAVTGDRHLYKIDAKTGDELHKEEIASWVSMSSPVLVDDTLFFGGGGTIPFQFSAYDLETDEMKWQEAFPDVIKGLDDVPPAVQDNMVVTTALEPTDGDDLEHFMYALDTETGELLWKESLGVGEFVENNKSGAPMIDEDTVYVGSPITETFYAYDLTTGEKRWEFENETMKAPPVAKDGIVYFSNVEGFVYALDAETGEEKGKVEVGQAVAPAGPIIVNDTMFIGSQDSFVYATPLTAFTTDGEGHKDLTVTPEDTGFNMSDYIIYGVLGVFLIVLVIVVGIALKKRKKA